MRFSTKILPSRCGNVGIIELNNLKSLNALDLDMIRAMTDVLSHWQKDDTLKLTLVTSVQQQHNNNNKMELKQEESNKKQTKFFCAGGDVKSIYESIQTSTKGQNPKIGYGIPGHLSSDFFREEYILNYKIATQQHSKLPQISIWDGIVMGGGVGITIHGKYRIATENTIFAMPETAIGFFPDVGSMYWIPTLLSSSKSKTSGIGLYLALTGTRLKADDLLYTGIATHYIPSNHLQSLRKSLIETSLVDSGENSDDIAKDILSSFHLDIPLDQSILYRNKDEMDDIFCNKNSVKEIITYLETRNTKSTFASNTLATLRKMSPTSLKVTYEGLHRSKSNTLSLKDVLKMEYRMSQRFMQLKSDFHEGIRAVLVDKDYNPKWDPSTLDLVDDNEIQSYFDVDLGCHDLDVESHS